MLNILLVSAIVGLCLGEAANFSYENELGPDYWPYLYAHACAGKFQSPIDIMSKQTVYDPSLKDFAIFHDPPLPGSKFYVHNNGHSIQVHTRGKFYVSNAGLENIYKTSQFHFHWGNESHHGSEHTIDGQAAPMEMHIVNWNSDKYSSFAEASKEPAGLAVLGIRFEVSKADNPALTPLVNVLKHVRDPDKKLKSEIPAVSMRAYLPKYPNMFYRYNGSLTTPRCFESVIWTVFYQKQTISRRQLLAFRQVLKPKTHRKINPGNTRANENMLVNNYRPVQPLNGRTVYRSFPFFGEPIQLDTEVIYLDTDSSQQEDREQSNSSASSVRVMSVLIMVCSVLHSISL